MIDFTNIIVGHEYDRPALAEMWGYQSFNAISRGVFTPRDTNVIILFITKEKQETLTQYEDHIDADTLFWEGEKGHGNDQRIISRKDEIHVFYRGRHHSDFIYKGRALLLNFHLFTERPSKFVFQLVDQKIDYADIVAEVREDYLINDTEKEAIIKSRIGQGLYRQKSINLWETCCITGFSEQKVLIASHIKPWKFSDNQERIDPYNSLLLVPTLDKLFDKGFVTFSRKGNIILSDKIEPLEWQKIKVNSDLTLRFVPEETKKYLEYHNEYVFELNC